MLQLCVIVGYHRGIALRLERFDARFDRRFIDTYNIVVLVDVDVQCVADRHHEVFLIQLGVTLDGIVFDVLGDVAQLGQRFVFQFVMCVRHVSILSLTRRCVVV